MDSRTNSQSVDTMVDKNANSIRPPSFSLNSSHLGRLDDFEPAKSNDNRHGENSKITSSATLSKIVASNADASESTSAQQPISQADGDDAELADFVERSNLLEGWDGNHSHNVPILSENRRKGTEHAISAPLHRPAVSHAELVPPESYDQMPSSPLSRTAGSYASVHSKQSGGKCVNGGKESTKLTEQGSSTQESVSCTSRSLRTAGSPGKSLKKKCPRLPKFELGDSITKTQIVNLLANVGRPGATLSPRRKTSPIDLLRAVSVSVDASEVSPVHSKAEDNTVRLEIASFDSNSAPGSVIDKNSVASATTCLDEGLDMHTPSQGGDRNVLSSEHNSDGQTFGQKHDLLKEQTSELGTQNDSKKAQNRIQDTANPDSIAEIKVSNIFGNLKTPISEDVNDVQVSIEAGDDTEESENETLDSDEEDLIEATYDIEARRKRNVERNRQRMKDLGIYQSPKKQTKQNNESRLRTPEDVEDVPPRHGMLFSTAYNKVPSRSEKKMQHVIGNDNQARETIDCLEELYLRYPHRQSQIKILFSMMSSSVRQASNPVNGVYVPAPIFVSGPPAVGKTSVVRDVVNTLKRLKATSNDLGCTSRPDLLIGSAYVNCSTLEPSSIDALVQSAYRQLVEDVDVCHEKKRKRKRKKPTNLSKASTLSLENNPPSPMDEENKFVMNVEETEDTDELEDKITRRLETARKKSRRNFQEVPMEYNGRRTRARRSCDNTTDAKQLPSSNEPENWISNTSSKVEEKTAAHGAPVAFGRAIAPLFGNKDHMLSNSEHRGCAFLILDHAERLLSLSSRKKVSTERNNFLAQLLLLPKVMGLNLTIISITSSNLLDCSRVNNVAPTQKALGTIKDAVAPLRIHFPSYKGKEVFKDIFNRPEMKQLITGQALSESPHDADEFQKKIYSSFLDLMIQSLSGCTRNIREMIKLGRLWTSYIKPLSSCEIDAAVVAARVHLRRNLSSVEAKNLCSEITVMLNTRILPEIRAVLEKGFMLTTDFPTASDGNFLSSRGSLGFPFLTECLMIAAFICQHNKADKDKKLFTKQKNGKRNNRKRNKAECNIAESLAYGSNTWEQQQLKMLRPRSFPLERMLSVFVNIAGIIEGESLVLLPAGATNTDDFIQSAGTSSFFECLAQLREIGVLRQVGDNYLSTCDRSASLDRMHLSSIKYWCELTREDADEIAKNLDFPLSQYLM